MDKTSGEAEVMRMGDAFGRQAPRAPTGAPALACSLATPLLQPACCSRRVRLHLTLRRPHLAGRPA